MVISVVGDITGHKTVQMVMRHINVKALEVATMMHGEELDLQQSAAGYKMSVAAALDAAVASRVRAPYAEPIRVGEERYLAVQPRSGHDERAGVTSGQVEVAVDDRKTMNRDLEVSGQSNDIALNFGRRTAA